MKILRTVFWLALVAAGVIIFFQSISGSIDSNKINYISKSISKVSESQVYLEGRWKEKFGKEWKSIPKINTTKIFCDRQLMSCTEYLAKLITKNDTGVNSNVLPLLGIEVSKYSITEWTDTAITAKSEPRAVDVHLRISLVDKSAELSCVETSARGATGVNPNSVELWVLE